MDIENIIDAYNVINTLRTYFLTSSSVQFCYDDTFIINQYKDKGWMITAIWEFNQVAMTIRFFKSIPSWIYSISPNNKYIVSANDKNISIWNFLTKQNANQWKAHNKKVISINITPDNRFIVSGSEKNVKVWELESGKLIWTSENFNKSLVKSTISPDGKFIVFYYKDKTIKIWKIVSGKLILVFEIFERTLYDLVFSPDSKFIVSYHKGKILKIWELELGKLFHTSKIRIASQDWSLIKFSKDGKIVIYCNFEKKLMVLDLKSSNVVPIFKYTPPLHRIYSLDISQSGKYIVIGSTGSAFILIWKIIQKFDPSDSYLRDLKKLVKGGIYFEDIGNALMELYKKKIQSNIEEFYVFLGELMNENILFYMQNCHKCFLNELIKNNLILFNQLREMEKSIFQMEKFIFQRFYLMNNETLILSFDGKVFCKLSTIRFKIVGRCYLTNLRLIITGDHSFIATGGVMPFHKAIRETIIQSINKTLNLDFSSEEIKEFGYQFPIINAYNVKQLSSKICYIVNIQLKKRKKIKSKKLSLEIIPYREVQDRENDAKDLHSYINPKEFTKRRSKILSSFNEVLRKAQTKSYEIYIN